MKRCDLLLLLSCAVICCRALPLRSQTISCVPNTPNEVQCSERGKCDSTGTGCVCYNPYNYWASEYCSVYHIGPELQEGQICNPNERNIYCHDVGVCNSDGTSCICDDHPYRTPADNCESFDISRGTPSVSPHPTYTPSRNPTVVPTLAPVRTPTLIPTLLPTLNPTLVPTVIPTSMPTLKPTSMPTVIPTSMPTLKPTYIPTLKPTSMPTVNPTSMPNLKPTSMQTLEPTSMPTVQPTSMPTSKPTSMPTVQPTSMPTSKPTSIPTVQPTSMPTLQPTFTPTFYPTTKPSMLPTRPPTCTPTAQPSSRPTNSITSHPTHSPSVLPTNSLTDVPTYLPSFSRSEVPTSTPSPAPTHTPSCLPTYRPVVPATPLPTTCPSVFHIVKPTFEPTMFPSPFPTSIHSPSPAPTYGPTSIPTQYPTSGPSLPPTVQPTKLAYDRTLSPTFSPTTSPTCVPSCQPTRMLTTQPTRLPTYFPTAVPTYYVVSAYSIYDSNSDLSNTLLSSSRGDNEQLMAYAVNNLAEVSRVDRLFTEFVTGNLATPFDLEYYQASIAFSGVAAVNSTRFYFNYTCSNETVTNELVKIVAGYSTEESMSFECGGVQWQATPGFLCVGCDMLLSASGTPATRVCSQPEIGVIALYTEGSCIMGTSTTLSKHYMVMYFLSRESAQQEVATIESLSVITSRNYALVHVNVSTTPIGGQVYCDAFSNEELAVSKITRSALKAEGHSVMIPSGNLHEHIHVIVNITDLIASTLYNVYCYIEDSTGLGITHDEVLFTKTANETLCCREISYLSAPTFVTHGVYGASHPKYIFEYDIQAFPEEVSPITVAPLFFNEAGAPADDITAIPPHHDFSTINRKNGLSRTFIVSPLNARRVYTVVLDVSGPGAAKYLTPPPHELEVIGLHDNHPPPRVLNAVFSKSGRSVSLCFDSSTDYAASVLNPAHGNEWKCTSVFSFTGSDYASCSWTSDTCVTITFCGSGLCAKVKDRQQLSLLEPLDIITLRDNTVKASCYDSALCATNEYAAAQSVTVNYPATILQPVVYLTSSRPGGECQTDLVLDASASTGNGGRPWKSVEWKVSTADQTDASKIWKLLNLTTVISAPIRVPFSLLSITTYTISLRLSNFMRNGTFGVTTHSVAVTVLDPSQYSKPSVNIEGSALRTVKRFNAFSAQAVAKLPDCSTSNRTIFTWKVYKSTVLQPHIKSVSPDPSKFKLDPYTLDAGGEYKVYVYATLENGASNFASLAINVDVSSVYVSIRGASSLLVAPNSTVEFDASNSVVEDVPPFHSATGTLLLSWSCTVTGMQNAVDGVVFGDTCDHLLNTPLPSYVPVMDIVPVDVSGMITGVVYTFTAAAFAPDGSYEYDTVSVQVSDSEGTVAQPSISTSIKKFSSSSILQIHGKISQAVGTTDTILGTWELFDDSGNALPLESYLRTPARKVFSNGTQDFPLSCIPNSFASGRFYTFRLTTTILHSDSTTSGTLFSELTLSTNGPPSSGELTVSPSEGIGMETRFLFDAPYWIDDIEDYPLYYTFFYKLSGSKAGNTTEATLMTLGISSQKSYLDTFMPNGLNSENYSIACSVHVSDIFGARAEGYASIVSHEGESAAYVSSLWFLVNDAVVSGDLASIVQTVNTGAIALSAVDCSNAPDCVALNRAPCFTVVNTCGSCMDGFYGVHGESNIACVEESEFTVLSIGDTCQSDAECTPYSCVSGACSQPQKPCPTTVSDSDCSGHGVCLFKESSSLKELETCAADNANCLTQCSCSTGFYGTSCGLTYSEFVNRTGAREFMCQSLEYLIRSTDPSHELLQALSATLTSTFDPHDVVNEDVMVSCLSVLRLLNNITDMGYLSNEALLNDMHTSPHVSMGNIVSKFSYALSLMLDDGRIGNGTLTTLIESIESELSITMDSLISSVSRNMVGGESTYEIVSDGVKASVSFGDAENLSNAVLTPPASGSKNKLPTIILPSTGLRACGSSASAGQYVRLSLLEWTNNPYITAINVSSTSALTSRVLRFTSVAEVPTVDVGPTQEEYSTTYELLMQYTSPQNWSQSDPGCTTFTGGSLTACPCDVLSYSAYEVKFKCYNLLELCPPISRRRLRKKVDWLHSDHPHFSHYINSRRRLDFDYEEGDDDGDGASTNLLEYGAMVDSIGTELVSTLLNNPADIVTNMKAMIPLLTVLSLMFFIMIITIIWLSYWDDFDANYIRYVQKAYGADKTSRENGLIEINARRKKFSLAAAFMTPRYWKIFDKQKRDTKQRPVQVASLKNVTRSRILSESSISECRSSTNILSPRTATCRSGSLCPSEFLDESRSDLSVISATLSSASGLTTPRSGNAERFFTKHIDSYDSGDNDENVGSVSQTLHSEVDTSEVTGSRTSFLRNCDEQDILQRTQSSRKIHVSEKNRLPHSGIFYYLTEKVGQYFDDALPPSSLLAEKDPLSRFVTAVIREHDWIRIFTYPSLRLTRVHRYFIVCTYVLIILFVDALFFGILFPDDQSCEEYNNTTPEQCENDPSPYSSALKKCIWDDDDKSCTLRPPPSSVQFYMVVAISVSLLSVLPQIIVAHIIEDYASQKPRWYSVPKKCPIQEYRQLSELHKTISYMLGKHNLSEFERHMELHSYYDQLTVEEEANVLLCDVQKFLENGTESSSYPWRVSDLSDDRKANLEAIQVSLGVYVDGTPEPLSLKQRVLFHTARQRIEWKLERVRDQVQAIQADMESFIEGEEGCRDTALIQHFILEQVSPIKRFLLRKQFFQFDNANPAEVDGTTWLMCWALIIAIWLFCMYWILQWAAMHSRVTMLAWGAQVVIAVIQDVFINEVILVMVTHVFVIENLRPQLKKIYHTLNYIMNVKVRGGDDNAVYGDVRVVQHLSASCRAARTDKLCHLPAAQLLMKLDDKDVALCRENRAAKMGKLTTLCVAIPVAIALSHEMVQECMLDVVIPTAWCCFIIANGYLYEVSPYLLALPYVLLFLGLLYRYAYVLPNRKKEARLKHISPAFHCSDSAKARPPASHTSVKKRRAQLKEEHQVRAWKNMNRGIGLANPALDFSVRSSSSVIQRQLLIPNDIKQLQAKSNTKGFVFADSGGDPIGKIMNKVLWQAQTEMYDSSKLFIESGRLTSEVSRKGAALGHEEASSTSENEISMGSPKVGQRNERGKPVVQYAACDTEADGDILTALPEASHFIDSNQHWDDVSTDFSELTMSEMHFDDRSAVTGTTQGEYEELKCFPQQTKWEDLSTHDSQTVGIYEELKIHENKFH